MLLTFVLILITTVVSNAQQMAFWLTDPDANITFQQQPSIPPNTDNYLDDNDVVININESVTYQTMDGFGFALTDGSATNLANLTDTVRAQILEELFGTDKNSIGISYLRLSIGASDLGPFVYSYDDLPAGQTDVNMTNFDLGFTRIHVVPILKQILAINPSIKLLGSPWSPPTWMKTNKATIGGSLLSEYFDAYALYFVRYIQEMQNEGITLDAITIQNEPMYGGNNPSCVMSATDQAQFIKQSLGPAFRKYSIKTKIIVFDHNCDIANYAITILKDPDAKQYVDGSAFHLYGGDVSAMTGVHNQFPDKNIYFTERTVFAPSHFKADLIWHVNNLIIGAPRNWAKNVIQWNLASNPMFQPHTNGGCGNCEGAITISGSETVSRNVAYYIDAHAAKFVRPNSIRIDSTTISGLPNVAFRRTDVNQNILIVLNENNSGKQTFQIQCNGKIYNTSLNGGSVGTYIC
jgi:glucosylceramidase